MRIGETIYLDCNSTTPLKREVFKEVVYVLENFFGNPSSVHSHGQKALGIISQARLRVASLIGANLDEIVFTSGGTESNNMALNSLLDIYPEKRHIVISSVEHSSVYESAIALKSKGYEVTLLPVDEEGVVSFSDFKKSLRDDTLLASFILVNNETGVRQNIKEMASFAGEKGIFFHTDAVQGLGKIPIDVEELNVDLMSITSHKISGPKGAGALYVRRGVPVLPLLRGGGQENKRRSGTENVSSIAGFGKACELAGENLIVYEKQVTPVRDYLQELLASRFDKIKFNGAKAERVPNSLNVSFGSENGESLLIQLDLEGICVSTGSACGSKKLEASRVLKAMGVSAAHVMSALRFSLGFETTKNDIEIVVEKLVEIIS